MTADELDTARKHLTDLMGYLDWADGTLSATLRPESVRAMAWKALDALNSAARASGGVQPAPAAETWKPGVFAPLTSRYNHPTAMCFNCCRDIQTHDVDTLACRPSAGGSTDGAGT